MPAVTAPMAAFAERCKEDRHHFPFIISPEDAGDMPDLTAFTRDLARQMETDLGTRLDWVAVDHWNTDNPHVHLLVRGVDEQDADLVISPATISARACARAPRNWSPSNWAQNPSTRSAIHWRGRFRLNDGRGSTGRSGWRPMRPAISMFAQRTPASPIPRSGA
jgi:hypothetical protein